jgi:pimeloyl-ACP methyl ester carboxylesterase
MTGRLLVCVSGLGGSAEEWAGVAPALRRHGDVITLEPATGGAGGPLRGGLEALDPLLAGAPGPAVLLGHSLGAVVSLLEAATSPQRVAGVVLTAPFVPVARDGRSTLATAADYARHRVLFAAGARGRRRDRAGRPRIDRSARASGLRALARYGLRPDAFHAMADGVSCPVLLVHGGADHHVPPAFARAAAARHPAWRLALIAGAGHFPHRDDAAAWLAEVGPWLERLP